MRDLVVLNLRKAKADLAHVHHQMEELGYRAAKNIVEPEPDWLVQARARELALMERLQAAQKGGDFTGDIQARLTAVQTKLRNHDNAIARNKHDEDNVIPVELVRLRVQEGRARLAVATLTDQLAEHDRLADEQASAQEVEDRTQAEQEEWRRFKAAQEEREFQEWRAQRANRKH